MRFWGRPDVGMLSGKGSDHQGHASYLHGTDRRGRHRLVCRFQRPVAREISSDDPVVGEHLGRVHPVPRLPRRDPQDCLHNQFDRVTQLEIPPGGQASGPFPHRASRHESPVSSGDCEEENRSNLTGQINGWKRILNTLTMHYGDRIAQHVK